MVYVLLPPCCTEPLGSLPITVTVGVGTPVLVTVNENGVPATTAARFAMADGGRRAGQGVELHGGDVIRRRSVGLRLPALQVRPR